MISSLLLVLGSGALSASFRTFRHPLLFLAGTFGMVATSFLAGWLLGGSPVLGAIFASTWFLLPWLEILTRVRRLRLPIDRRLESCPPPGRSTFPNFAELSGDLESAGFEFCDDAGWKHEQIRQFYRFYYREKTRTLAAICLIEQDALVFYYVALTSRAADGRVFMTWNYPFSYGLHLPPKISLNRAGGELSIAGMTESHATHLKRSAVRAEDLCLQAAEGIRADVQNEMREQVEHNLACGILKRDGGDMIRYSARGMVFLWFQFLRDFVRIS